MRTSNSEQDETRSFEFSFRPEYGDRLFVHLPAAALAVLGRGLPQPNALSLVADHATAICAWALAKSRQDGTATMVVSEADAASILAMFKALSAAPRDVKAGGTSQRVRP